MGRTKAKVIYRKAPPLSSPDCKYPGFAPGTTILKKGTEVRPGHKPLESDIMFQRDTAIKMRDGKILYADIFRPVTDEKVPVILNSTTFGKNAKEPDARGNAEVMEIYRKNAWSQPGVPKAWTSGLESFESSDPGFWVPNNYAVCNLDIRGCYMSQGKGQYFGTQEAEDDYDVIEWLAAQDWCNGKVTMTGNSWLGIVQWFAAAERPPHLACIAPWEGWNNMYRDEYMIGGIPGFDGFRFANSMSDTEEMEDVVANILAHPLLDEYWEDKVADLDKIDVPAYIVASYDTRVHSIGTFRGWRKINTTEKWLRVHNTQEWRDLHTEKNEKDLLKFFDHYMKGIDNGWENTPRVRLSLLNPGGEDVVERVEEDFPLKRQQLTTYYLDAENMTLEQEKKTQAASVSYCGFDEKSHVSFKMTFKERTEIAGYVGVKLWVECFGYNDMDLFIKMLKVDKDGNPIYHYPVRGMNMTPYSGPWTRQRVSLRKLDPMHSTPNEPVQAFDEIQKLHAYEIVPVEVCLTPTGMVFEAGETLSLDIAGFQYDMKGDHPGVMKMGIDNNGNHIIHTGGEYDSRIILPIIPEK